jgi:hypothetical protein
MTDTFNPQFQKIGEILIHLGKLSESQLQEALVEQKNTKEKLGLVLINSGVITEDDLVTVYSMQLGYKKADEEMLMNVNQEAASKGDRVNCISTGSAAVDMGIARVALMVPVNSL